jgi:hypothetical protein
MQTVRLLKAYRGYRAGETFQASERLAAELERLGVAVRDAARPLLEPQRAERAVATHQAVEAR